MLANDSLDAWWCFKLICILKTLIQDVKDSLLRTLCCVADLSRNLNMDTLLKELILKWDVRCRWMLDPGVPLSLPMLIFCDMQ